MYHEEVVESGNGEGADDFEINDVNWHATVIPKIHLHRVQENCRELENLEWKNFERFFNFFFNLI